METVPPPNVSITKPARKDAFERAWHAVMAWDGETPIYNPEYKDHKDRLSRVYDGIAHEPIGRPALPRDASGHPTGFFYEMIFSVPSLVMIPKSKLPAKIRDHKPANEAEERCRAWWLQLFETWRPVAEKLVAMKAKTIPGRRPSDEQVARERLLKLPATQAARDLIAKRVAEVTRDWRREEIERVTAQFAAMVSMYQSEKEPEEQPEHFWRRKGECLPASRPPDGAWGSQERREREKFDERVKVALDKARSTAACINDPEYGRKTATMHADAIIETFTGKMQEKLGFAVTSLATMDARSVRRGGPTLNCELAVKLTSGASFTVRNQIVGVWGWGTPFYRFPTTFHDISLPGHTGKIAMASEEEMNALFAPGTTILSQDAEKAAGLAENAKSRAR